MDVRSNVTYVHFSRRDSSKEACVDCIPTHKSKHIYSGCLLGGEVSSNTNARTVNILSSTVTQSPDS